MTPLHIGPERSRRHGTIFVHVIGWFCYGHYRMVSQKVVENCRQKKSNFELNKVVLNPQKVSRYNISPNPLWLVVAQMDLRNEDSHFWIGIFVAHLGRQICPSLLSPVFVSSFCLQVLAYKYLLLFCLQVFTPILSIGIYSYFYSLFLLLFLLPISTPYFYSLFLLPTFTPAFTPYFYSCFYSLFCLSIFFAVSVDYYSPLDRGLKIKSVPGNRIIYIEVYRHNTAGIG